ncbi:cache domain-containing sensor histidine kinase [Paenibacillus radicis (ex Gao et al. 2016)]|uniref:Sensor histidine kinase YesM n=1 Tax=Paenibacillus radicis (ex Gao et al. 2016) TaxID=1737354 RepID=A0A917LXV3_9BACL|nr:sensor histidine kinase [Paenibacillus radicis (ex Gao et al. 2016)]GGG64285.1 sensor histidine kinase YesM [Paenibacillus radicis (ex Gao et al. 2016)]
MKLKLRHKLVLFVIIGAVAISFVGLLYVQRMQTLYERLVYEEASDKLYLYSERMEEKLNEIDKFTLTLVSDPDIQERLKQIKHEKGTLEYLTAVSALKQKLLTYPFHDYSIKSIVIVDTSGNEYLAGSLADAPVPAHDSEMIRLAADKAGASYWVGGKEPMTFLSVRQIRAVQNMDLQPLGTLIIRVEASQIVSLKDKKSTRYNTSLIIQDGEKPVYSDTGEALAVELPAGFRHGEEEGSAEPYSMLSVKNHKYLATYSTLAYTGWTFIHLVPYESLFEAAVFMRRILLVLYGCIFAVLIWFGLIFSRSITRSLEELTLRMAKVEKGDFSSIHTVPVKKPDEIGLLTINFSKMADRLDHLIKENYVKQIHLKESQYETLKAKLNPHFLYNTLDSINWLARRNGQAAISKMVKALGDMLRNTISRKEIVTLRDEMTHLNNYFSIQQFRFEHRLHYEIEIAEELQGLYLPSMILQPIVENCMKYGIDETTGECEISISGERFGDRLDLWITDRGPGMDAGYLQAVEGNQSSSSGMTVRTSAGEQGKSSGGFGLRSIHERIHLLYGDQYGISIHRGLDQGTTIRVSLPVMTESEAVG